MKRHQPDGEIDYRVGDVVICKATGAGLQAGRVYLVDAVLNRRAGRKVETTVTVRAGEQLIEIASPEAILGRTRLLAELSLPGQPAGSRYFANAAELQSWCDLHRVKREDVFAKYIEL